MAKSIQPTPALSGSDAQAILDELAHGPRQTPERKAMLAEVSKVHPEHLSFMTQRRSKTKKDSVSSD